jgi:hypothetical protein
MRWAGPVVYMGKIANMYRGFGGKLKERYC